ncbi:MAG: Pyrrolo-quinoline quinone [Bradyrhizobium sp.]|nr:Pyrrolo-quinoline quinone [Bradyrhizobium sp.]
MSLDVDTGLLHVPAGSPAPDFDKTPPGENLYTGAIVALDARTGKLA